jgi:hypothetical protein
MTNPYWRSLAQVESRLFSIENIIKILLRYYQNVIKILVNLADVNPESVSFVPKWVK